MSSITPNIWMVFLALAGVLAGYFLRQIITLKQKSSLEVKIKQQLLDAKTKAQETIASAVKKAELTLEKAKEEQKEREKQIRKTEERLGRREELMEKRQEELGKNNEDLKERIEKVRKLKENIEALEEAKRKELEKVASLSENEAKEKLFESIEKRYETDLVSRIQKMENYNQSELERRAKEVLAGVIQRLASSTASEITTTSVAIPSDDIKGKIIGKEGRNIRAIERAAGVEVIVDDTPGSIVISAFDPIRRQIAKIALEHLILDGRIQPARIEEMVEKAKSEVEKIIKEAGEAATYEAGVFDIDHHLLNILGRLHFRTSYGQNILRHSIETSHIAGMLAAELAADVPIAKKAALLHDIGKAVDHEVQGSHVDIGKRILKKFNADEKIIQAMQSHHEEYPYETLEAIIVHTADAISASRPGARRDTLENYLKRLEDLEEIANSFEGVEKSYAIQAGREIRIFVTPEKVSDLQAKQLARNIADRIEQDLKYPGEIKVNLIRENRVVEYAR